MSTPDAKRRTGREVKALVWTARHPVGTMVAPATAATAGLELGWATTGGIAGGTVVALCGWYRAHPATFDHYAAPRLRAWRRRWGAYLGPRFNAALRACDLCTVHRKTDEEHFPRIIRTRSFSPTVDTLWLRIPKGMHARHFEAKLEELADALRVQRVAVERVKPGVVGLVIERKEPFTETIPAPEMPQESEAVDPTDIYVGETEFGQDWRLAVLGQHTFIAGATGAGKNSIPMSILRALAPMIRDGLVRLWLCDPKQMEFGTLAGIAYRYATSETDCADLVGEFVDDLKRVQHELAGRGDRKITISPGTPLNLLIVDEIGALLAYNSDTQSRRELARNLAVIGSQGRATGHSMMALVQEPTKDTVPIRDLFTVRICLRVTAQSHVDMTLGENARLRGAIADEIPNIAETAGIGYVVQQRTRVPVRVRASYVTDTEIEELVTFVHTRPAGEGAHLQAVA
ncbi:cell division protein FtsK [Prauserella marina]|uniref:DNA segregation ATPase FtsK/SpoIIIE, S-DNA-T family n=1 Tax=Prauserella marina TaxID=530584 RepID=A0A222VNQ7_9PSEU|nr:FtsK/SpoIIIE domain-containing protein [Prauserella marina]ASR35556.1 cell division protein FtsK [Prauserella marina]PWV84600.1 S-DNA-T family DNA segregation ATPase FtsK/SpoIIIE [Prauserella marina]SDC18050.1 DNA segregation ATPase FtsK/SpoIIIE, S-DNA-T family [Prauserella marina]